MQRRTVTRLPTWFAPGLTGLIVAGVLAIPLAVQPDSLTGLELAAGDAIFLRDQGPHLGYRPHRSDVVRILYDEKSAGELGGTTEATDIALYAALVQRGASVVADPRPVNTAAEATALVKGLDALNGAAGHIFRNIQLPASEGDVLSAQQKASYVGGDMLYTDAAQDVNRTIRYYPLLWQDAVQVTDETLMIKAARVALGQPLDPNPVRQARDVGVLGAWIKVAVPSSQMNQLFREAEAVKPQPYPIGPGHSAPWVVHPSVSTPALVSPASIYINYRSAPGPAGTYPVTYSYADALLGRLPPDAVRGKAVVVDSVAAVFSVPTSAINNETWGGVDAQVLEEILDNAYLVPVPGVLETPVLLLADILIALVVGILTLARAVPVSLLLVVGYGALALLAYRAGGLADVVVIPLSLVATPVAVGGYRFVRETLERRRIYDLFGRYVPRTVVAELVRRPAELATELGGTKREVTVLFADIRGFTAWSAELPPDQVIGRLNELLSVLVGAAFEREGTVDKYIGDAVMVIWNAPINQPDHVQRAVQAGLEMARRVRHQQLGVGIGIHCGEAVVGNVGTVERLEYTAIGSTVNMAARLCESAARGEVVISEAVRDRLAGGVELEPRAELHAKGIAAPLRTYRVIAASASDPAAP